MSRNLRSRLRGAPVNAPAPVETVREKQRNRSGKRLPGSLSVVYRNLGEHERTRILTYNGHTPRALLPDKPTRERLRILSELAHEAYDHAHMDNMRAIASVVSNMAAQLRADESPIAGDARSMLTNLSDMRMEIAGRLLRGRATPTAYTPTLGVLTPIPDHEFQVSVVTTEFDEPLPADQNAGIARATAHADVAPHLPDSFRSNPVAAGIIAYGLHIIESVPPGFYEDDRALPTIMEALDNRFALREVPDMRQQIHWFFDNYLIARRVIRGN